MSDDVLVRRDAFGLVIEAGRVVDDGTAVHLVWARCLSCIEWPSGRLNVSVVGLASSGRLTVAEVEESLAALVAVGLLTRPFKDEWFVCTDYVQPVVAAVS